jgi:hypothetical protein
VEGSAADAEIRFRSRLKVRSEHIPYGFVPAGLWLARCRTQRTQRDKEGQPHGLGEASCSKVFLALLRTPCGEKRL